MLPFFTAQGTKINSDSDTGDIIITAKATLDWDLSNVRFGNEKGMGAGRK